LQSEATKKPQIDEAGAEVFHSKSPQWVESERPALGSNGDRSKTQSALASHDVGIANVLRAATADN
jgi:hypothetical protein